MKYSEAKTAGTLLFVATTQFALMLLVSETLVSSYSVSSNYISDLGVKSTSYMIFNSSVFIMGLFILIGAIFLQKAFGYKTLTTLLILTSIGTMGVGLFTENSGSVHILVSALAFLFGGFSSIASYKLVKQPFSFLAIVLGGVSLTALILFATGIYGCLGAGGMERMILYPILMWGTGFGGFLIGQNDKQVR
jgi:hypothetical membrane protein